MGYFLLTEGKFAIVATNSFARPPVSILINLCRHNITFGEDKNWSVYGWILI